MEASALVPRSEEDILPIVRLWILRILMPLGGYNKLLKTPFGRYSDDSIPLFIGLGKYFDLHGPDIKRKTIVKSLKALHKKLESDFSGTPVPSKLRRNIDDLGALVGLSATDRRILEFRVLIEVDWLLSEAIELVQELSSQQVYQLLTVTLGLPLDEVRSALQTSSTLARSGLLTMDHRRNRGIDSKLSLLSTTFANNICTLEADPISLLSGMVTPSDPPKLTLDNYSHIESELSIAMPYLKSTLDTQRPGVNILIHGQPGTGKTQLVKTLAAELSCDLLEVATEDSDGDPIGGMHRLRAYRTAQHFFAKRRAIIAFDEIEDVFNDVPTFHSRSSAQAVKGWMNRMLEANSVPGIWVSNSIAEIDPAMIRRFDIVFEIPVPPRAQRRTIFAEACGELLDDATVTRMTAIDKLAPAVAKRAAGVVANIQHQLTSQSPSEAFELIIKNTLKAQGHNAPKADANSLPSIYDPALIKADADVLALSEGLIKHRAGRLCIYGPPGTGKTAYGKWLAEKLEMPISIKRASDLVSKWVGQTERNIANAFEAAAQDGALLQIDEVDSFLQDRRSAQQSWQVSEVNEMLTQMESFNGIFIASTNLMDGLDQAALRRFDLKMKFGFLGPDQISGLLLKYCEALSLPSPKPAQLKAAARLQNLTPGDFAAVARQNRFLRLSSPANFVAALSAECELKEAPARSIGFH